MRLLVTGANGFIGGHLVERLLAGGHAVLGVDHREETWQRFGERGDYRAVRLELGEPASVEPLQNALHGVEAVFHLASRQPYSQDIARFVRGNVVRTATLLEAMAKAGVERLVHSSTFAVYGAAEEVPIPESAPPRPQTPYEVTKHQAEQLVRLYADQELVRASVLRYPSLYGGRNRVGSLHYFLRSTLDGETINLFDEGKPMKEFVHVEDVVDANLAALRHDQPGRFDVFNIGSGEGIAMRDLVQRIFETVGRETGITHAESVDWRETDLYLDIGKARRELGYAPRSLEDGLRSYAEALRAEGGASA